MPAIGWHPVRGLLAATRVGGRTGPAAWAGWQRSRGSQPVNVERRADMATTEAGWSTTVTEAFADVERAFPFPGYITRGEQRRMAHVIECLAPHLTWQGERVLDIGAGPMEKTAVLARLGLSCYAVDDLADSWHRRDDNARRIADFAERMGITFHRQAFDDYTIPFPQGSFDLVTIFAVIEHLHESPRTLLDTAGQFLRPGGLLCVTMPNAVNLRKRLSVLRGRTNYPPVDQFFHAAPPWRGHVREYTLAETVWICREAGFEVLSATTCEGEAFNQLPPALLKPYLALTRLVPTLRTTLCVVARKPRA